MALQLLDLSASLASLGDPSNPHYAGAGTAEQASKRLADAYDAYAQHAADAGGNALVAGNVAAMQAALAIVFASSNQTAPAAAQGLGAAHAAYWASAQFAPASPPAAVGIGGTGIFSVVLSSIATTAPTATLVAAMTELFLSPSTDGETRANAVAQAWDAATRQVALVMTGLDTTPAPVGPLPVTLVALVH